MRVFQYKSAFVVAVVVVVLNTAFAYHALRLVIFNQSWVTHTLDVIAQVEALQAQVHTAEEARWGYAISGNERLHTAYLDANRAIDVQLATLQRLTIDNPTQQTRLKILRADIADKMERARQSTDSAIAPPPSPSKQDLARKLATAAPDPGRAVTKDIDLFEAEEQRLLATRAHRTATSQRQAAASLIFASGLDLLLLLAAYALLTRESAARAQVAEKAQEVHVLNEELEARVQRRTRELETTNQELEAFSYSVSHDLRAPLRSIDGFSLALLEDYADKLDAEGRDYLVRVRNGVQRMGQLIDALLQLSRVTRSELQREQVDVTALVNSIAAELQASEPDRLADFVVAPDMTAMADPRLLRIALENLLGNAWKFTQKRERARIEMGTLEKDGKPVYYIRDNGAGFDMQYVDRLFGAFQRLHGDRDFKGSGIGLATVSRVIRRHQGTVAAQGQVEGGATFSFTLDEQG